MGDPLFTLHEPARGETAVVVEVPHAGLLVPPEHMRALLAPVRSLGRDADLYVDELYAEATLEGASVLVAHASRYVIDLNRGEHDVDGESVAGAPAGRMPRGLIWRLTTDGERAVSAPLPREELEGRLATIYHPYHRALAGALERKVARFGHAVLLAAHSMPSVGRFAHGDEGARRADVVPGSRGRTSADAGFIDLVDAHARAAGWSVAHDNPYKGGFTTQHYGRPAQGVHAVQVELARRLYMDEPSLCKLPGRFEAVRTWCRALVAKLGKTELG
jgi:N-formylglutamate deformylase